MQLGLSYAPPAVPGLKLTGGYVIEEYFSVGTLGLNGNVLFQIDKDTGLRELNAKELAAPGAGAD